MVRAPEVIIETGSSDGGSAGPAVTVKGLVLTGVAAGRIGLAVLLTQSVLGNVFAGIQLEEES